MIITQSQLKIVDNSGGKKAKCIKIKGKSGKASANIGDIVLVSIQSLKPRHGNLSRARVNKSEVHRGVLVQTRFSFKQPDQRYLSFNNNSIVLIGSKQTPFGNRISTVLPRKLRRLKWSKLGSMSKGFI